MNQLLPMRVNGLYVGNDDETQYAQCCNHFSDMNEYPLGQYMEPSNTVFTRGKKAGVYLHWVLPSSMREGIHRPDTDETVFPTICNRWQVMRLIKNDVGWIVDKTMVLESDYLSDNDTESDVCIAYEDEETIHIGYLGRKYEYQADVILNQSSILVNALTGGDPTFLAMQPQCEHICSYYDDLEGVVECDQLHYLVMGYYVGIDDETICHGMVTVMLGDDKTNLEEKKYQVSIGSNWIDALSAKVSNHRLIHFLLNHQLDETHRQNTLLEREATIHSNGFQAVHADTTYTLTSEAPDLDALAQLNEANRLQHNIQKLQHEVDSLRQDGYTLWCFYHFAMIDDMLNEKHKDIKYNLYLKKLKIIREEITKKETLISEYGEKLVIKEDYKEVNDEAYWEHKEPTIMIHGNQNLRNFQYGYDGVILPEVCRTLDDVVRPNVSIEVGGKYDPNFQSFVYEACAILDDCQEYQGVMPDAIAVNKGNTQAAYISLIWHVIMELDTDIAHWDLGDDDFTPSDLSTTKSIYIVGRDVLSAHADEQIQSALVRYCDIVHPKNAQALLDCSTKIDTLSQTLGAFNEEITARRMTYQIPIMEYDNDYYTGAIYQEFLTCAKDVIGSQTQYGVIQENTCSPLKGGKIRVETLKLIDTFGSVYELETDNILISEMLQNDTDIVHPLRLLQPARVHFQWGEQESGSANPLLGWVRHNKVDQSLQLYTEGGRYMMKLKPMGDYIGVLEIDGTTAVLEEWKRIIEFLRYDVTRFEAFLHIVEVRQMEMSYEMTNDDSTIFMGQPLALLKSIVELQVMGNLIRGYDWCNSEQDEVGEQSLLVHQLFPMNIGDRRYTDDGLVGFFLDDEFYQEVSKQYFNNHQIQIEINQPLSLILLLDIHLGTKITTGLLPKKTVTFDSGHYQAVLNNIDSSFTIGPTIQPVDSNVFEIEGEWLFNQEPVKRVVDERFVTNMIKEGKLSKNGK